MKSGRGARARRGAETRGNGAGRRMPAGCSVGLAAGFAAFALLVPLRGAAYYIGSPKQQPAAYAAAGAAGVLWLICTAAGLGGGILLALAARRGTPGERWLRRAGFAAFGVYLLGLRGAWGESPALVDTEAGAIEDLPGVGAIPAAATVLTVALCVLATAALLWWRLRQEKGPAPPTDDAGTWGAHALFSLGAAHLTVQLPYYVSRAPGFFAGLGPVVRALLPG